MADDPSRIADAIEDLLDQERDLVLSGALDGLGRIATQKIDLMTRFGGTIDRADLERLRAKAARNAGLLEAAGGGIKSVLRRLAAIRNGPEPLSTYSAAGQRTALGAQTSTVEKSA